MKKFKFTIDGSTYQVDVKDIDGNIAELEVNGTPYTVEIEMEKKSSGIAAAAAAAGASAVVAPAPTARKENTEAPVTPISTPSPAPSGKAITVKAPLPGSITKLVATTGTAVKVGDVLLVMESMKMENNILAEHNGVVKSIKVTAGQAVLQDDVLLEIE